MTRTKSKTARIRGLRPTTTESIEKVAVGVTPRGYRNADANPGNRWFPREAAGGRPRPEAGLPVLPKIRHRKPALPEGACGPRGKPYEPASGRLPAGRHGLC
jgi:hypothetical protein